MAISKVKTTVVDVGQGQCTFAAVYDDSTPPELVHTLLFDCGSDKKSPDADDNIKSLADTLKLMTTPTIDLLVFSHSDNDHISLMYALLDAYGSKPLKILETWFAGDAEFYTKDGFNILSYLEKYCKKFSWPDDNESQFNRKTHDFGPPMWESADKSVRVRMLIGNVIDNKPGKFVATGFGTAAEKKNRVSMICGLFHDGRAHVICGDATSFTMAWVNWYFEGRKLVNTLMVTAPHHGSRGTGLNVSSAYLADQNAIDIVKTFAGVINAKTITVSAYEKHSHPSVELINYFTSPLSTTALLKDPRLDGDNHYAVCHVDVTLYLPTLKAVAEDYHTLTSETNLFATYYYGAGAGFSYQFGAKSKHVVDPPKFVAKKKPTINPHACWVYVTTTGGGNTVKGFKYLPDTTGSKFTSDGVVPMALGAEPLALFEEGLGAPWPPSLRLQPQPEPRLRPPPAPPDVPPPMAAMVQAPASGRPLAASSLARLKGFR